KQTLIDLGKIRYDLGRAYAKHDRVVLAQIARFSRLLIEHIDIETNALCGFGKRIAAAGDVRDLAIRRFYIKHNKTDLCRTIDAMRVDVRIFYFLNKRQNAAVLRDL